MTPALTTILLVIAIYAGVVLGGLVVLWRVQERIVFQPPVSPESPDAGTSRLEYASRDGIDLFAQVVEPEGESRAVVLAFHGNAVIARWLIPWARELSRRSGVTVVLPEYRGYDGISGSPTYPGSALDAEAALDAASLHFGIPVSDMVLYGHSLGSAVACEVASDNPPRALVLESPFSSAHAMAARWKVFGVGLFWSRVSRIHYDTLSRVAEIPSPVHVAHGERDIIVPPHMGLAVHAAAKRPGRLLRVPEAGHNDVALVGGEAYWRWIEEALQGGRQ